MARSLNRVGILFCLQGLFICFAALAQPALAVTSSRCLAMANLHPLLQPVGFTPAALQKGQVEISYVAHSTFRISSPGGIVVATDYAGVSGSGRLPDVVTMNHAHETHYTDHPDPGIKHVLRGWNPKGGPARHNLTVGDVFIRNVSTDIRSWVAQREKDGNSIFIFEMEGLCIGHLGHLHHELAPEDLGLIGQLDIVMAPVDGTYTISQDSMINVLKLLKARLIIPMHAFGPSSLAAFVEKMGTEFEVEYSKSSTIVVSSATLPRTATILVLPEARAWSFED